MSDLATDPLTGDILIKDFDLQLVEKVDKVIQSLTIRLRFIQGEWFLDTQAGTPYYSDVWLKNPNIPNLENVFKAQILDTEDVIELLEFDLVLGNDRSMTLSFKCNTIYGIADFTETIFTQ